jgi:hypothetical protein
MILQATKPQIILALDKLYPTLIDWWGDSGGPFVGQHNEFIEVLKLLDISIPEYLIITNRENKPVYWGKRLQGYIFKPKEKEGEE